MQESLWNLARGACLFLAGLGGAVFIFTVNPAQWARYPAWIFFLIGGIVCLIQGMRGLAEARTIRTLLDRPGSGLPASRRVPG